MALRVVKFGKPSATSLKEVSEHSRRGRADYECVWNVKPRDLRKQTCGPWLPILGAFCPSSALGACPVILESSNLIPFLGATEAVQFPTLFLGFHVYSLVTNIIPGIQRAASLMFRYSTVTLLARFLGLSTSQPRDTAM